MSRCLAALLALASACRPELPPIEPEPMPAPDGRPALLGGRPLSERLVSYRIAVSFDGEARRLTGRETLRWRNDGPGPVEEVPLHLYMNAFKNEGTIFMREALTRGRSRKTPNNGGWGWIEVTSIRDGDRQLRPAARHGEDETTLWVPLGRAVAAGETLALDLEFTTQLPRLKARTGYEGDFAMVGQWFPKVGVRQAGVWHCDTFHGTSEFFADFGTYDVELTLPDTLVVAATGVLVAATPAGAGQRTLTYHAEDVHDFAFMADPHMKVLAGTARVPDGEVAIRVYHRPGHEKFAPRQLEAARRTIETWSRVLVPYPWPIMNLIDPPWGAMATAGGMEYPMIVTTGGDIDVDGVHFSEEVTVHEVTHNWFQGMVASNEVDEAFLDEGLTQYASGVIMDDLLGADRSTIDTRFLRLGYYDVLGRFDTGALVSPVATRSYEIAPGEYGVLTYGKTAQILKTLEGMVGRDRLLGALGVYARRQAFKHPRLDDLLAGLREGLGEDFGWFLGPALRETGGVDFRVVKLKTERDREDRGVFGEGTARRVVSEGQDQGGWRSQVTITRAGRLQARVEIAMRWSDGSETTETWDGMGSHRTFTYERPVKLVAVEVDPRRLVALEHERVENGRAPRATGPAWRAGARAAFWLQTAAQVVGP